jgi:glycosyltransferase involved in cell wall biosynthesis
MRIAVVELSPSGGLLHYMVQLGDALADRGNEVDLIMTCDNELAGHEGAAALRPVLTPFVRSFPTERMNWPRYQLRRLAIAARLARAWGQVLWHARRGGYDVVLLGADPSITLGALAMLALSFLPGRPRIAFIAHNVKPFNRWAGGALLVSSRRSQYLLGKLYPRFDLVIVHGERSRIDFEKTWPPAPLVVVPHGDERLFGAEPPPPSGEEHILFFGDWRKVKGLSVLMDAFDELVLRRPSVHLTIAGTTQPNDVDPQIVKHWAERHGAHVTLIDRYVPIDDVMPLFATARVVVIPYLVANQSGVLHVAMTMARAVVASRVGDITSTVVDGETGMLVPPGDASALADALERLVGDQRMAEAFGAAGHRRMLQGSSWQAVAAQLEPALLAIANEEPGSRPAPQCG